MVIPIVLNFFYISNTLRYNPKFEMSTMHIRQSNLTNTDSIYYSTMMMINAGYPK